MTTTPAQSGSGWLGSATSTQSPASRPKMCLACAPSWSPWNNPRWSVKQANLLRVSYYIIPHYTLLNIQPIYSCPSIGWILKISGLMPSFLHIGLPHSPLEGHLCPTFISRSSRCDCRNKPWSTSSIFPALKWFSLTSQPQYSIFWCFLRLI